MIRPQTGERINEFLLERLIGAGRFAQVWKAHHHVWKDDFVAVKFPTDPQLVQIIRKEALAIHDLRHANIVQTLGLDPYADLPYLLMEFVDGVSLQELIARFASGMPVRSVQSVMQGLLSALGHAHAHGVVHGNIKPSNILIATDGVKAVESMQPRHVKVGDFGLNVSNAAAMATQGSGPGGAFSYLAPEQREGVRCDARSDLYAGGVVLFEMITGERPTGGDLPTHVREGLPGWVDEIYSRLYTRSERRLGSADEVLRIMELDVPTMPPAPPPIIRTATASRNMPPPPPPITSAQACKRCGAPVERGDNFCIKCGTQVAVDVRRCAACGGVPLVNDLYCMLCGTPLPAKTG